MVSGSQWWMQLAWSQASKSENVEEQAGISLAVVWHPSIAKIR